MWSNTHPTGPWKEMRLPLSPRNSLVSHISPHSSACVAERLYSQSLSASPMILTALAAVSPVMVAAFERVLVWVLFVALSLMHKASCMMVFCGYASMTCCSDCRLEWRAIESRAPMMLAKYCMHVLFAGIQYCGVGNSSSVGHVKGGTRVIH